MPDTYQPVVTAGIVALWGITNLDELKNIGGALIGKGDSTFKQDVVTAGKAGLGAALIALGAGISDDLGKILLALTAGLWLLYLMHPGGHQERASRQPQTNTDQLLYGTWPFK